MTHLKISTHQFEDLQSHLPALFVFMLAPVLLTGSCWADRAQTAECQTGCPYSRIESWTASSCVSLPVVPLWTWQSGLHFHTCTHKNAPHNTIVFWSLKFNQNWVPTSYQILTYLLTPCSRVLLQKLTGLQLVKKFPAFYGTWRFITTFTNACHLSLSWPHSKYTIYLLQRLAK